MISSHMKLQSTAISSLTFSTELFRFFSRLRMLVMLLTDNGGKFEMLVTDSGC